MVPFGKGEAEMEWLILSIAIVSEVIATAALKLADGFTRRWPWAIVVPCYCLSLYLMSLTLDVLPVGMVYAIWAGSGDALMVLVGRYFFKQVLDRPALIGIGMIAAGVVVLQFFSASVVV
jgi:small multidrug resistance pump